MAHDITDDLLGTPALSEEEIAEFKCILKKETGADLTPGEARLPANQPPPVCAAHSPGPLVACRSMLRFGNE